MAGLEAVVGRAVARFQERLAEAMEETEATPDQQDLLRNKFTEVFAENVRLGLVKTFGRMAPGTAADLQPEEERTAAELDSMQEKLEIVVDKRARYPIKASHTLDRILANNRDTLKILKAEVTVPVVKMTAPDTGVQQMRNLELEAAQAALAQCKEQVTESADRSERFLTAFSILRSNSATED